MAGLVTGISDKMIGRRGEEYKQIYFKLDDGSSALTYVSPSYRNFNRWIPVLTAGIGAKVDVLKRKGERLINGDSKVFVIAK